MTGEPVLTLAEKREPQAEAVVTGGLADYNRETFGRVDTCTLDVLARDDDGEIVGGLLGRSSLGLFFLDLFYLSPKLRRGGLGSRMIALAEDEARRRGCTAAFVYTVTFRRRISTSATAIAALARSPARPTGQPASFSPRRSDRASSPAASTDDRPGFRAYRCRTKARCRYAYRCNAGNRTYAGRI
jgi:GNAT superfamily N-acetyltransferase